MDFNFGVIRRVTFPVSLDDVSDIERLSDTLGKGGEITTRLITQKLNHHKNYWR